MAHYFPAKHIPHILQMLGIWSHQSHSVRFGIHGDLGSYVEYLWYLKIKQ